MSPVLPADHALRRALNDEVHARPPEPMQAPSRLSYLALLIDPAEREAAFRALCSLAGRYAAPLPVLGANHYSADFGPFRLKWERHTEFVRYTFLLEGAGETTALSAVPDDWVASLPGKTLVAVHLDFQGAGTGNPVAGAERVFSRETLVGSTVADGVACVFADFQIRASGFSRMLVQDQQLTPWQAGRIAQRLLEIDTYRMMALLALPVAQELAPAIAEGERELARVGTAMVSAGDADEPELLERLTRLAAEIDSRQADTVYRFNAASAYYGLVQRRIADLRESRLEGLQTLGEFFERRLAPAMNTCDAVARRQEELSRRMARATQLLATRVGLTREQQNQRLLAGVNRRIRLQLRLQSTVEGLSVAAITYYVVGLVAYAAKGIEAAGVHFDPSVATAAALPVVALLIALALRRMRRRLHDDDGP